MTLRQWALVGAVGSLAAGCRSPAGAGRPAATTQSQAFTVTAVDPTIQVEDHFIASVEMQVSGEPFAQAMGRDLAGYSRDYACPLSFCSPDTYYDPALNGGVAGGSIGRTDLAGFSSAVESYEYSKQPMNNVAFESGAGTSLLFGPVLDPQGATGASALAGARAWVQHLAAETRAAPRFVSPVATPDNPLGWPGLWLTLQPYTSFDPTIHPTNEAGCSISSDDDPGAGGALVCDDYECDYSSLRLADRTAQTSMTIGPGASGWVAWKDALWAINYLQVMHDAAGNLVKGVADDQLADVGTPGNAVLGLDAEAGSLVPGTYLGSSDIEGFQAGNFIQILDNGAAQWLGQLTTTDGVTLSGFGSIAEALSYDTNSPLRWFPGTIAVTETPDDSGFPRPAAFSIASPDSHLLDLAGMLGGYATAYALTDRGNAEVGGSQPVVAYFDGDPFPVQNQVPDGEPTLHDRTLALIRVLVVDMARLHFDASTGLLADDSALAGGSPALGRELSTTAAAYALVALRTARRALDSSLALYTNTRPDAHGVPTPLDAFTAGDSLPFSSQLDALIAALTRTLRDRLTTPDGRAYAGWDRTKDAPTDDGTSLDAHTAAVRGLLAAYLATGDTTYRDRATAVFQRVESSFYDPGARVYRSVAGDRSAQVTFTPRRFALLQAMLRDVYELVAVMPGNDAMRALIEDRVGRLNKLVLNGWDDRDGDGTIAWPNECAHLGVGPDGAPLGLGGLQMGERVLSGESGSLADSVDAGRVVTTDREHDCVPEISAAQRPAALAASITFTLTPWSIDDEAVSAVPQTMRVGQ